MVVYILKIRIQFTKTIFLWENFGFVIFKNCQFLAFQFLQLAYISKCFFQLKRSFNLKISAKIIYISVILNWFSSEGAEFFRSTVYFYVVNGRTIFPVIKLTLNIVDQHTLCKNLGVLRQLQVMLSWYFSKALL